MKKQAKKKIPEAPHTPPKKRANTRGGAKRKREEWPELDASQPGGVTLTHTYRPTKAEIADGDT